METIYSIIIPSKNTPALLERCVLSIPEREDTEIIVIDDNSGYTVEIEKSEFISRKNLHFIKLQESKGAGYARNIGIEKAKGKWLLFADADDFYTRNLNALLDKYREDEKTDIVYLNAQSIDDNGTTYALPIGRYIKNFRDKRVYSEKVLRFENWVPWTRMVKREMVLKYNIKYEEIQVGNDVMFCLTCSKYAKSIDAEIAIIYNYYKPTSGSCTFQNYNIKSFASRLSSSFKVNKIYKETGYIFKRGILKFLHHNKFIKKGNETEYNRIVNTILKENNYKTLPDIIHTICYYVGKITGII